jgi:hypothetical protein
MRFVIALAVSLLCASLSAAATRQLASPQRNKPPDNLRLLHGEHYRIHTDLDRALAEDLAKRMDAMYEEYSRRLASTFDVDHAGDKADVYLFAKRQSYLDFTNNKMSNAGGIAMPESRTVASEVEHNGRDGLRRCLQHEAFHLFAHEVIHPDMPPWLNEGLAVMFEEGIWTGRMFILGQVPPWRVRQLQQDINSGRLIDFETMLNLELQEWNQTLDADKKLGSLNYNQAWAMCHFLVYATENGQPKYRARFLDLLQRIKSGTKPMAAFKQSFSANIPGFQARFVQWAKQLKATPEAAIIERQTTLADMLVRFRQQGKSFDSLEDFKTTLVKGSYQMQYMRNDVKWTSDPDPRVYFRTLDGRSYNTDEMYFDTRSGAPISDLVCSPVGQLKLRTRFYDLPKGSIEHETLVEGGANGR